MKGTNMAAQTHDREKALELARTIEPEFQIRSLPDIEQRLQSVR